MKRTNVLAFWLGLAVTLTMVGVHLVGGLRLWERQSIDFRFKAVPRVAPPMSDDIVHVDIDDGAFDAVGRWPWDRSKMADVIDELRRAGAGSERQTTVALDLLLSDEQQYPEGSERRIDHDQLFGDALGRMPCLLAISIKQQDEYLKHWRGDLGRTQHDALLSVLEANIELDDEDVLQKLADAGTPLTAERKAYFLGHPARMRRAAAFRVLQEAVDPPQTLGAFEKLVAPDMAAGQGDYPERRILESVLQQSVAWGTVQRFLLEGDSPGTFEDAAPLPIFADQAGGFGFVNVDKQSHPDGVVREMIMKIPAPGGTAVQFGLSAAMLHRGIDPGTVTITDTEVDLGETRLPLRDGKLWIAWPALTPHRAWLDGLGIKENEARAQRRLSIAVLVGLAKNRRVQVVNRDKLRQITYAVLHDRQRRLLRENVGVVLSDDNRAIARDYISFEYEIEGVSAEDAAIIDQRRLEIRDDPEISDEARRRTLAGLENATQWVTMDADLGDGDPDALAPVTREVFERLTLDLLAEDQLEVFDDARSEEYYARAIEEVDAILSVLPLANENRASADHRANCALWRTTWKIVADGDANIQKESDKVANQVRGKLVFVGWTATGAVADFVSTAQSTRTPGVNVHSAIAHMAMTGDVMQFASGPLAAGLVFLVGLLCTLAAVRYSTLPSALVAGIIVLAYVGIAGVWMFSIRNAVFPLVAPVTAGGFAWVAVTALQAALVQRDRLRIERQFKARVSTQLVDHLVTNPDAITVTGEEREMTTIFADLAGFTTVAETLGGSATVSTLNRYMCRLTDVLIEQGAYVNKFLGDGVMAFWSAFALDKEQATRGCIAAVKCQQAVRDINAEPGFENIPKISMRVGVATGNVVVGDCGAPPALNDYTVIGDAVNLAARLESANKQFGTGILINGRTQELLEDNGAFRLRSLGRIIVVGQNVPVPIFEVLPTDAPDDLIELTERAVAAYAAAQFKECLAIFEELEQKHGQEKLAGLYRDAIDIVGDDFDGTLRLVSK